MPNKQTIQLKYGQGTLSRHFSKEDMQMPTDMGNDAQHHSSSGKCKLKPQRAITSHLSEWLSSIINKQQVLVRVWRKVCKFVQPLWKTVWRFIKKSKIEVPHDPEIPLLSIYLMKCKTLIPKTHAPLCSLQHSVHQPRWKQPKCPSLDKWINKSWCLQTMKHYLP